jgi:hypothetical protein
MASHDDTHTTTSFKASVSRDDRYDSIEDFVFDMSNGEMSSDDGVEGGEEGGGSGAGPSVSDKAGKGQDVVFENGGGEGDENNDGTKDKSNKQASQLMPATQPRKKKSSVRYNTWYDLALYLLHTDFALETDFLASVFNHVFQKDGQFRKLAKSNDTGP